MNLENPDRTELLEAGLTSELTGKEAEAATEEVTSRHRGIPDGKLRVPRHSILASILTTLLLRVGSRVSFVVLGFYLGENFASAALAVVVIEAFYISELLLAPVFGSLSDKLGRKLFMLLSPVVGSIAVLILAVASFIFPRPDASVLNFKLILLLLVLLAGRLLEGVTTALNAPANLGYLTDATVGAERLRARVVTAYEVATVGGIALAIPFGGQVSHLLGTGGFFVVIGIYILAFLIIHFFMEESLSREEQAQAHGSLTESLSVIREKRIFTFIPAWLSINALIGAWLTLITIMLAYPTPNAGKEFRTDGFPAPAQPVAHFIRASLHDFRFALAGQDADARHPHQLFYGGFSRGDATMIIGAYGVIFLLGMGLWMLVMPYLRRTTIMLFGVGGLGLNTLVLIYANSLADNPASLADGSRHILFFLLPFIIAGIVLQSGFTPASLTHLAAISETLPGKRGAVMGLYSVLMGLGQLVGTWLGGVFVDLWGFYGLMIYSLILGLISISSVLYMRSHGHDFLGHGKR